MPGGCRPWSALLSPFSNLKPDPPISLVILLTTRVACLVSAPDTGLSILAPCPPFPSIPAAPSPPGASPGGPADGCRRRPRPAAGWPPAVARPGPPRARQRPPGQWPPGTGRAPARRWLAGQRAVRGAAGSTRRGRAGAGLAGAGEVEPARTPDRAGRAPLPPACTGLGGGRAGPGPAADHPRRAKAGAVGRPSSACARPPAPRCCAGHSRPTTVPCAGCRSPPTAANAWASCSARRRQRATPPRPACACSSTTARCGY